MSDPRVPASSPDLAAAFSSAPSWTTLNGAATPARFADLASEVRTLRSAVGLSALPHIAALRVTGRQMWEVLDPVLPADLFLRDLQLRQTLLLDERGLPVADVYVGNDDDGLILIVDGLPRAALVDYLHRHIRAHAPTADYALTDLGATHTLLGLDGPFAWEAMTLLEGPDIIGFPYGSFFHPSPDATYFRAGRTGEFGYLLLVPHAEAPALWRELVADGGPRCGLREVGSEALAHASLENWFFDVHREGVRGLSPIELQLQWRLATERKDYVGSEALAARVVTQRIVALEADAPLTPGAVITYRGAAIGRVLVAERSLTLGSHIGVGLVERAFAHSGIDRYRAAELPLRTLSPPFVNNLSLYVSPQQHRYATRHEIAFPGPDRRKPSLTTSA